MRTRTIWSNVSTQKHSCHRSQAHVSSLSSTILATSTSMASWWSRSPLIPAQQASSDHQLFQQMVIQANQQVHETRLIWYDEDDITDEKELDSNQRRKWNTWSRPGGCNNTWKGRPLYWEIPWGIMLRDPHLQYIGSPKRKIFMRRFRNAMSNIQASSWVEKGLARKFYDGLCRTS